ncbi:hypothetical protein ACTXT7_016398 [Hymenolepis weldensis]
MPCLILPEFESKLEWSLSTSNSKLPFMPPGGYSLNLHKIFDLIKLGSGVLAIKLASDNNTSYLFKLDSQFKTPSEDSEHTLGELRLMMSNLKSSVFHFEYTSQSDLSLSSKVENGWR